MGPPQSFDSHNHMYAHYGYWDQHKHLTAIITCMHITDIGNTLGSQHGDNINGKPIILVAQRILVNFSANPTIKSSRPWFQDTEICSI